MRESRELVLALLACTSDSVVALGLFPAVKDMKSPLGVAHYRLFWTRDKNYLEIEGEHLDDVLALESHAPITMSY